MEQLDFQIMLTDNYYPNQNLYFSIKIKKSSNKVSDIDTNLITVNNCFDHLIKEISTTRYENDKQLIATFLPYEIYHFSDSMPKRLPKNSLDNIEKTVLYSRKPAYYNKTSIDGRINNEARGDNAASKASETPRT